MLDPYEAMSRLFHNKFGPETPISRRHSGDQKRQQWLHPRCIPVPK
jgi:hypothetical protein